MDSDDSSGGSELEEWEEGSEEDPGYAEYYSFNDDEGRASQVPVLYFPLNLLQCLGSVP